jgi:hypothetical protein
MFANEDKIDQFFKDFIQAPIIWPAAESSSNDWNGSFQVQTNHNSLSHKQTNLKVFSKLIGMVL